jgi:hypothetical protein
MAMRRAQGSLIAACFWAHFGYLSGKKSLWRLGAL